MSATRAILSGLPLSSVSIIASSSALASIASPSFQISLARAAGVIFVHGPLSKALRAAATARSTSSLSLAATWAMTSPSAGL